VAKVYRGVTAYVTESWMWIEDNVVVHKRAIDKDESMVRDGKLDWDKLASGEYDSRVLRGMLEVMCPRPGAAWGVRSGKEEVQVVEGTEKEGVGRRSVGGGLADATDAVPVMS